MKFICVINKGEGTLVWPLEIEDDANPIVEIKRQLFANDDGSWTEDRQEDWDSVKGDLHWFYMHSDAASLVDMVHRKELIVYKSEEAKEVLYATLELVFEQFRCTSIMKIAEAEDTKEDLSKETYENWAEVARDLFDVTLEYYKEISPEKDFTPHLVEGNEEILKEKGRRYNLLRRDFSVWCSLRLGETPSKSRPDFDSIMKITQYPGEILSVLFELVREYIDETYHMGDPFLGETTKKEAVEDFQLYYATWLK